MRIRAPPTYTKRKEKNRKRKIMEHEMININAHLVKDVVFSSFESEDGIVPVVNFSLVKKYGKGKEYTNCSAYGDKVEIAKEFEKGDLIHVFGYFKENRKGDKVYKNFIVKSMNKIEQDEMEEE